MWADSYCIQRDPLRRCIIQKVTYTLLHFDILQNRLHGGHAANTYDPKII